MFTITPLGVAALWTGALVLAVAVRALDDVRTGPDWIISAVAGFLGGLMASEIGSGAQTGPIWQGIGLVPAILVGSICCVSADLLMRWLSTSSHATGRDPASSDPRPDAYPA